MIREIRIENEGEIEVYRPNDAPCTHIILMDESGYTITLVLPDGDVLETVAEQLMVYSLLAKHPEKKGPPF